MLQQVTNLLSPLVLCIWPTATQWEGTNWKNVGSCNLKHKLHCSSAATGFVVDKREMTFLNSVHFDQMSDL